MNIKITSSGEKLIFFGAVLFLLGLFQGTSIPYFHNPRMALSGHLAAVQSGMALMIFGLIWGLLVLKEKWLSLTYYFSIISMYFIWLAITLSAVFGASKSLPIAGNGFSSSYLIETIVSLMLYIGSAAGIISIMFIVWGLYRGLAKPSNTTEEMSIIGDFLAT